MNFGGAIVVETRMWYSVAVPGSTGDTVGGGKSGGAPMGCSWFSCSLKRGNDGVITDGTGGGRRVVGPAGHKGVYRWYCRR